MIYSSNIKTAIMAPLRLKDVVRTAVLMLAVLGLASSATASAQKPFNTFTLHWENDAFTGTDEDYTNGIKFTWSTPLKPVDPGRPHLPGWGAAIMNYLPFVSKPGALRAVSISVGQNIFTPRDTQSSELITDDRPYAGYSYVGLGFQRKNSRRRDTWELDVGIIGPHSYAEDIQNGVHDLIGSPRANGWANQLNNELGISLICETKWRNWQWSAPTGFGSDLISHMGGGIGNVAIYANTGLEWRLGWYLPANYGSCPIRPGCDIDSGYRSPSLDQEQQHSFGGHLFASVDGRAVAHNIFLDGNTFSASHSVDKESFVADLLAGLSLHYESLRLSYAYVVRTREFKTQGRHHNFGAVALTWVYAPRTN